MKHKNHILILGVVVVVLVSIYIALLSTRNNVVAIKDTPANSGNNGKNDNLPAGISARLTGHGESDNLNIKLTIAAVVNANKEIAGGVSGQTIVFKSFKGIVTEVVPPSNDKDYWCVNSVVRDVVGYEGYNWLWFVKDVSQGIDQLSSANGIGLSCENVGAPVIPFENLTKGDFKGEVRN